MGVHLVTSLNYDILCALMKNSSCRYIIVQHKSNTICHPHCHLFCYNDNFPFVPYVYKVIKCSAEQFIHYIDYAKSGGEELKRYENI